MGTTTLADEDEIFMKTSRLSGTLRKSLVVDLSEGDLPRSKRCKVRYANLFFTVP